MKFIVLVLLFHNLNAHDFKISKNNLSSWGSTIDSCSLELKALDKSVFIEQIIDIQKNNKYIYLINDVVLKGNIDMGLFFYDKNMNLIRRVGKRFNTTNDEQFTTILLKSDIPKETMYIKLIPLFIKKSEQNSKITYKNIQYIVSDRKLNVKKYLDLIKLFNDKSNEKRFFDSLQMDSESKELFLTYLIHNFTYNSIEKLFILMKERGINFELSAEDFKELNNYKKLEKFRCVRYY